MIICDPNRMQLAYAKVSRAASWGWGGSWALQEEEEEEEEEKEVRQQQPSESQLPLSQCLLGSGGSFCNPAAGVPDNGHKLLWLLR